jgi:hypothetical protein
MSETLNDIKFGGNGEKCSKNCNKQEDGIGEGG